MAEFLVPDWPAPANVRALVTTRAQGNLALHAGDKSSAVVARRLLRAKVPSEPKWLNQVHGTRCVAASLVDDDTQADAVCSRTLNEVCAVLTADCLPVLLCDTAGSTVAAAHAGWRGLVAGIIESTVASMGLPPQQLMAWLGPAIGPAAFEVGDDVRAAFVQQDAKAQEAFAAKGEGKWWCDLYALARQRLVALGVRQVYGGGRCTYHETESFFSYRRERDTGRMASLIWLI